MLRNVVAIVVLAVLLLGCPDPNLRVRFEQGKKLKHVYKAELLHKKCSMKLFGLGHLDVPRDSYRLFIAISLDYSKLTGNVLYDPDRIDVYLDDQSMSRLDPFMSDLVDDTANHYFYVDLGFSADITINEETYRDIDSRIKIKFNDFLIHNDTVVQIDSVFAIDNKLNHKFLERAYFRE